MPNHSCNGDTVFVEGKGCRQACPFHEISFIKGQILNWKCFRKDGAIYSKNSSHILAEDHCELICPEHYLPHPYMSTRCENDGNWRNRDSLQCLRSCSALSDIDGALMIGDKQFSKELTGSQAEYFHVKDGEIITSGFLSTFSI